MSELESTRNRMSELESTRNRMSELESTRNRMSELESTRNRMSELESTRNPASLALNLEASITPGQLYFRVFSGRDFPRSGRKVGDRAGRSAGERSAIYGVVQRRGERNEADGKVRSEVGKSKRTCIVEEDRGGRDSNETGSPT